jgi:hypothetical protein
MTVRQPEELGGLRDLLLCTPGPVLGVIKTAAADVPRVLPERDGHAEWSKYSNVSFQHRFSSDSPQKQPKEMTAQQSKAEQRITDHADW